MRAPPRACLLLGLALGCASVGGGVSQSELPEDPIAFTYFSEEEARERAEAYQDDLEARSQTGPAQASYRGGRADLVASDDDMGEVLARLLGVGAGERDEHQGRLALLDPRTSEVTIVKSARRGSIPLDWTPERDRLLFAQPDRGGLQIYEYTREEKTVRAVTYGPSAHTQACYGPGGRIVLAAVDTRSTPLRSRIEISGPGGRGPFTALTEGPYDHSPACQPRGETIAFVREDPTAPRSTIYVLEGSEPRRLSPGRHPSFSPDGEWIAFAAPLKRELRIWRIRPDGSGRAPIGRGIRHEARPTVSPDGRLVAYVAAEERPRRHLYLRRFDGSGDRILFSDGDGEFPVW